MISEDTADWEGLVVEVVIFSVQISETVINIYSYEL
jgi:hypothetical protein